MEVHDDDRRLTSKFFAMSGCPVKHSAPPPAEQPSGCPVKLGARAPPPQADGCPVMHAGGAIDPTNMMPSIPKQQPAPNQTAALPTERVTSSIPRGADDSNWVYPSQQMFFNALQRKGKAEGGDESAMAAVVSIHNNMNESTWRRVLEWEALHSAECAAPKLLRFMGRPDELTPKARVKVALGLADPPFDRHDWVVDRCGREVRYLIDYYDVAARRTADRVPATMHDEGAVPSIELDVRPALDSAGAAVDRARMLGRSLLGAAIFGGTTATAAAAEPGAATARDAASDRAAAFWNAAAASGGIGFAEERAGAAEPAVTAAAAAARAAVDAVREKCAAKMAALAACEGQPAEEARASIDLTLCLADQVCQKEAAAFRAMKGSTDGAAAGARFEGVQSCLAKWAAANE